MKVILAAVLMGGLLTACTNKEQTKTEENMTTLNLVQEWDKVFPLSEVRKAHIDGLSQGSSRV